MFAAVKRSSCDDGKGIAECKPLVATFDRHGLEEKKMGSYKKQKKPQQLSPTCRLWLLLLLAFLAGVAVDKLFFSANNEKNPTDVSYSPIEMDIMETPLNGLTESDDDFENDEPATYCAWSPDEQYECMNLLSSRLPFHKERLEGSSKRIGHRFLFFGDSTVFRLTRRTNLAHLLVTAAPDKINAACGGTYKYSFDHEEEYDRCNFNEVYGLSYRPNKKWVAPDYLTKGEGPAGYGAINAYCKDCSGCQSEFLVSQDILPDESCEINDHNTLSYGGYIGVEFARDVEMQTPQHRTTQENIATFLSNTFNTDENVEAWGKPVCVLSFGHHDAAIPNVTSSMFENNAEWYLSLMNPECEFIIFLGNTSPKTDDYAQKIEQTREWNNLVGDVLERRAVFREKSFFLDPFEASSKMEHADNVHMVEEWYDSLSEFFINLIEL